MAQKLDSKKIEDRIKQIDAAGKAAVKALNEMTDGGYANSDLEKDPLTHIGYIGAILRQARDQAKLSAKYEGLDEEQIAQALAEEREQEKEELQTRIREKLESRKPKAPEPIDETADTGETLGTDEPNDPPQE